jgi:cytochrome P450
LGSLNAYRSDPKAFLLDLARYGDVVSFWIGGEHLVQVTHPEYIEQVLLEQHRVMHKDALYKRLKNVLGEGLVTSEGALWKRQRRLAAKPFGKKQVDSYAAEMVRLTRDWCTQRADGDVIEVNEEMMGITQLIVLRCLFGTDFMGDTKRAGECLHLYMNDYMSEIFGLRRLLPRWVPTTGRLASDRYSKEMDQIVLTMIAAKRAGDTRDADDVLSRLIAAAEDGGVEMSDRQLRDEAVTFFAAGHETTALTLTYAFYLLSRHPEARERLVSEVSEVLAGAPATAALARRLPWTRAVVQESMRCYPPVWAIGREPQEDIQIGPYDIPAGTQVLVSQWVMHHDPRWFPDPWDFAPQRWIDGLEARLPRFAYFPFGGGPRVCIGNHFGMLEAIVMLATVAQHWTLESTSDEPLPLNPSVTLRPGRPIHLRLGRL